MTEHLSRIPLFLGCSTQDLQHLARATDEVRLAEDTVMTRQGEIGREAFIILDGSAEVLRDGDRIAELGPGDVVGELSLLDGGPRSATVVTTGETDVLVLTRPAFNAVLEEIPTLAHRLLVTLARRLRAAEGPAGLS